MDTADDSRLSLTWHLRLPFWACLPWPSSAGCTALAGVLQGYTAATQSQA